MKPRKKVVHQRNQSQNNFQAGDKKGRMLVNDGVVVEAQTFFYSAISVSSSLFFRWSAIVWQLPTAVQTKPPTIFCGEDSSKTLSHPCPSPAPIREAFQYLTPSRNVLPPGCSRITCFMSWGTQSSYFAETCRRRWLGRRDAMRNFSAQCETVLARV